jgi:D-alanyl-D-alanine carboxypeptidase
MIYRKLLVALGLASSLFSCQKESFDAPLPAPVVQPYRADHPWAADLQSILDEYTRKGLPGVVVAIKTPQGTWEGTSGYAKIETNTKLQPGYVHPSASLTKPYFAAAILRLREQSKLELDQPITRYLPTSVTAKIKQADEVTVRMLLDHTSGIPDYSDDVNFQLHWYNQFTRTWSWQDALAVVEGKPLLFTPGSNYSYCNTDYLLLAQMVNHLTGTKEGEYLRDNVLRPAGLTYTYYKVQPGYLGGLPLPNLYLDRYGNGNLENVTKPGLTQTKSETAEGGVVATALDFALFMDALAHGRIISPASYAEMKMPNKRDYGLGLGSYDYLNKHQYGHSGGIMGAACMMLYCEEQDASVFIGCNVDTDLNPGKTPQLYYEMRNKIIENIVAR